MRNFNHLKDIVVAAFGRRSNPLKLAMRAPEGHLLREKLQ